MIVFWYNQAASAGFMPMQPWLALARPKFLTLQGASWMNSPLLVIRSAHLDFRVYCSGASISVLVQTLSVTFSMITLMPFRVSQPGLPDVIGKERTRLPDRSTVMISFLTSAR